MRRVRWSLPTAALRQILGLLLAVVGLVGLPVATASVMDGVTRSAGREPTTGSGELSGPWVPTAHAPRVARTTITVEATPTGARTTVEHVIELTADDLLYDAVRGGMIPPRVVVRAVIGEVGVRYGGDAEPSSYERFQVDRAAGGSPRITTTFTDDYPEGVNDTAAPHVVFTPPVDRRAAATTSTVTVRGVGYAVDAVLAGEAAAEQATDTTFTDPPGPVGVRLFRTAAAAAPQDRYAEQALLLDLIPGSFGLRFLAVLVPWLAFFMVRSPPPGRGGALRGATWGLIAAGAFIGAVEGNGNAIAAAAAPLLLAGWLADRLVLTRRAVRQHLLAAAVLLGLGIALLAPALSAAPLGVLVAGCAVGASVSAAALTLLTGWRTRAEAGAVAGAAGVLGYVVAQRYAADWPLLVAVGLLWAPLLLPVLPRRIPRWAGWAAVSAVAVFLFVVPTVVRGELRWSLPAPSPWIPWPVLARLALVGLALHLLWKHTGPARVPLPVPTVSAVRSRYRAFSRAAAAQRSPLVRAAGVALVLAAFAEPRVAVDNATIAYLLAPLAVLAALRPAHDDRAERLARITPLAFTRLLDARAEVRLAHRILDRVHRSSPAYLASGELSLDDFRKLHADAVAGTRRGEADAQRLPVLASAAGRWAARNGAAAALVAAGLAVPLVAIEAVELFQVRAGANMLDYVETLRRLGRWAAYGFFFGCFYTSLRGGTPVAKALVLGTALALPEGLLALFTSTAETPFAALGAAALRTGQVYAVLLLLGLFWEYRMARIGRVPWSYVRDLRQVGALAAPLSAFAVAVASAVVAVLVPELLGTAQPPPPGTP